MAERVGFETVVPYSPSQENCGLSEAQVGQIHLCKLGQSGADAQVENVELRTPPVGPKVDKRTHLGPTIGIQEKSITSDVCLPAELLRLAMLWERIPSEIRRGWVATAEAVARNSGKPHC